MYDKRTLQNRLLFSMFTKKYPNIDSSLIDTSLEFGEAEIDLKRRYPSQMNEEPKKSDLLSVNTYMHFADLTDREPRCLYCGEPYERKRLTKKYCRQSHRELIYRKRKKAMYSD